MKRSRHVVSGSATGAQASRLQRRECGVRRLSSEISIAISRFAFRQARRLRSSRRSSLLAISPLLLLLLSIPTTAQIRPELRSITVVTEPNATVWIDDMRFGTTDEKGRLRIAMVPPGIHSLRVRAQGFSEVRRSLPATARGDVVVALAKTTDEAELAYQAAEVATTVDRQKAISEYQRAIKLRATFAAAHLGIARMYAETGDQDKALKAVRTAKRLKPAYAEASAVEARLLKDTGEEDKAIAMFKRSITEGRGFQPEAYTGLGMLYKDRAESAGGDGDYDAEKTNYSEATKNLSTAVKQLGSAPDAIVVMQLLGLVYERQEKFTDAIRLYEEFLRLFPDSSEAGAVESFIVQIKKQMAQPK